MFVEEKNELKKRDGSGNGNRSCLADWTAEAWTLSCCCLGLVLPRHRLDIASDADVGVRARVVLVVAPLPSDLDHAAAASAPQSVARCCRQE